MKCTQFIDGHQVTDLIQVPQQRKLLIATTALNLPAWHTYETENGDTKRIGATHTDTQLESAGARTPYNTGPGGKLDAASIGCESSAADFVTI